MYDEFSFRVLTEDDFPEEFVSDEEYWEMLKEKNA